MPAFNLNEIIVRSDRSYVAFGEDYADALRDAINSIRAGMRGVVIYQDGEILHTEDELLEASDSLEEFFTDEDVVEEVHHAVRKLEGDNAAWAG